MSIEFKVFIACIALQAFYYLFFFFRLNFVRGFKGLPEFLPSASVVICARNEAKNLQQFLKIVLIQQYPQFEVIVVNDESTDNTIDVLVEYYMRNKNLKLINVPVGTQKPFAGKKYALQKGIEAATFDTIVVTDADCRPATTHWLAKMVGAYMNETQIVLGHSPYEKTPGFLNKLIRYENFITALQYFGFAKAGLPYMGVGRNLSYRKSLFQSFKGYEKKKTLLTGDDDLFVNASATSKNTEVCIDKDAFMYTRAEASFSNWINQKRRHLRSGFSYKFHHQLLLFLFALSKLAVLALFIWLFIKGQHRLIVSGAFAGLVFTQWLSTFTTYRKLAVPDLKFLSPVLDILYTLYLVLIFFLLLLKPKDNWKN
ncbi:MAG: glycosyltransferase [Chitinophagales bacterium]